MGETDFQALRSAFEGLGLVLTNKEGTRLRTEENENTEALEFSFDATGKLISWEVR